MYVNDMHMRASTAEYEREVSRHLLQAEARRGVRGDAEPADASQRVASPFAALRNLRAWTARRRSISHTAETR